MKVVVLYKDGTKEEFISLSTVIVHKGRKLLILIRDGADAYVPNSSRPSRTIASEVNIPLKSLRWWEVVR